MAEENIYEKIDEENLYEKPFDEPITEEPKYENQTGFGGNTPETDTIYTEIDVQKKTGRSVSPEYMNTSEATQETEEAHNGVSLYEIPAEENEEEEKVSFTPEGFGEPCDDEHLQEDNAEDGMMMAFSLPKGRSAQQQEEVVEYSLKPVQNNNVEEEEKPTDPNQPEIALFVKVGLGHYPFIYYTLNCIHSQKKSRFLIRLLNDSEDQRNVLERERVCYSLRVLAKSYASVNMLNRGIICS